jgi:hypothetical protein
MCWIEEDNIETQNNESKENITFFRIIAEKYKSYCTPGATQISTKICRGL